jgi:tripartite-type tricarboxylate transporter receptor subunit TctC
MKRRDVILGSVALGAVGPALAQAWPSRPIRLLSGFAAGSTADLLARVYAEEVGRILPATIVVENRTGAGGAIATDAVAKAPGDGYTFLAGTNGPIVIVQQLGGRLPFDPARDLRPVAHMGSAPLILVASPTLRLTTYDALVAAARRARPRMSFASTGIASAGHLFGEMFVRKGGIEAEHVPYRSGVQAFPDVIEGRVEFMFTAAGQALPLIREGKLVPIAVSGARRLPSLPDVPTVREVELAEIESEPWNMLFAPAATPDALVRRMHAAVVQAQAAASVQGVLSRDMFTSKPTSPDELVGVLAEERRRWLEIARVTGVTMPQ